MALYIKYFQGVKTCHTTNSKTKNYGFKYTTIFSSNGRKWKNYRRHIHFNRHILLFLSNFHFDKDDFRVELKFLNDAGNIILNDAGILFLRTLEILF